MLTAPSEMRLVSWLLSKLLPLMVMSPAVLDLIVILLAELRLEEIAVSWWFFDSDDLLLMIPLFLLVFLVVMELFLLMIFTSPISEDISMLLLPSIPVVVTSLAIILVSPMEFVIKLPLMFRFDCFWAVALVVDELDLSLPNNPPSFL